MQHQFAQRLLKTVIFTQDSWYYHVLRDSMWLYVALVLLCDEEGLVTQNFDELARLTGIQGATLRTWSGHLRKAGLVGLVKPTRQGAVFKVHGLPGKRTGSIRSEPASAQQVEDDLMSLACYLVKTLAEPEDQLDHYIDVCKNTPRDVVIEKLEQVQQIPDEKIRKSRASLFNYLIHKYAN